MLSRMARKMVFNFGSKRAGVGLIALIALGVILCLHLFGDDPLDSLRDANKRRPLPMQALGPRLDYRSNLEVRELDLSLSSTEDYSFLSEFPNLEVLDLDGSAVKNIQFIENLNNLRVLRLDRTAVEDISPVSRSLNLRELSLSGVAIESLEPIAKLAELEDLDLSYLRKSISHSPLDGLDGLRSLDLAGTVLPIEGEFPAIPGAKLERLHAVHRSVAAMKPIIDAHKELKVLNLSISPEVVDLREFVHLRNLVELNVSRSSNTSCESLGGFPDMKILRLGTCDTAASFDFLRDLPSLEVLDVPQGMRRNLPALQQGVTVFEYPY